VKRSSIILLAFICPYLWLAVACEDSELETDNADPFMRIVFINQDSLEALTELIADIDADIKIIDDSLAVLAPLNENGDFDENIASLNSQKTTINNEKTDYNTTIAIIRRGSVAVSSINSPEGINTIVPPVDSAEVFTVPLNSGADFSNFVISLDGELYNLEATYSRSTIVRQRTVIVEANNLKVMSEDFNDVVPLCKDSAETCTSNETTVTLYF